MILRLALSPREPEVWHIFCFAPSATGGVKWCKERMSDLNFSVKQFGIFFAQQTGGKSGYIANISSAGCLLKTNESIENRRWIRMIIKDESTHLCFSAVGRVVRQGISVENAQNGNDLTLYHYGIEFTYPNYFSLAGTDLILALSKRNLRVRSCLSLNSRSSLRPGFLA